LELSLKGNVSVGILAKEQVNLLICK